MMNLFKKNLKKLNFLQINGHAAEQQKW